MVSDIIPFMIVLLAFFTQISCVYYVFKSYSISKQCGMPSHRAVLWRPLIIVSSLFTIATAIALTRILIAMTLRSPVYVLSILDLTIYLIILAIAIVLFFTAFSYTAMIERIMKGKG